ncbi:MAG TPA: hypothetical protein VIX73_37650 [Kofleriaceae bacterium]|jgi:hypothetical protein
MIDPELREALKQASADRPESSEAAIVRQALREWFDRNGVTVQKRTARPRKRAQRS